jgi:CheY-like chemotaxis protein
VTPRDGEVRILIAIPDPDVRAWVEMVARPLVVGSILSTRDGADALERLGDAAPDVLIVNASLPGMPAGELIGHLRAVNPSLVAIMMSGTGRTAEAALAGADFFLLKPVTIADLRETIRRALARTV